MEALTEGRLRVSVAMHTVIAIEHFGVDRQRLLADCRLSPDLFDDPDNTIAWADLSRFIAACVDATGCESFGIKAVEELQPASVLGQTSELMLQRPYVGGALSTLTRYLHLHDQGAVAFLHLAGGKAQLAYVILDTYPRGMAACHDGAMGIAYRIIAALCGPDWTPIEVWLSRRKPRDERPYYAHFKCPLRFDAPYSCVVFRESDLRRPLRSGTPEPSTEDYQRNGLIEPEDALPFPVWIRRQVRVLLALNQCRQENIVDLLHIHPRTLNRRLREAGLTFRGIAQQGAFNYACQLLAETDMPLATIAATTGYADASTFSRWFKSRSGLTPGAWRKNRHRNQRQPWPAT